MVEKYADLSPWIGGFRRADIDDGRDPYWRHEDGTIIRAKTGRNVSSRIFPWPGATSVGQWVQNDNAGGYGEGGL